MPVVLNTTDSTVIQEIEENGESSFDTALAALYTVGSLLSQVCCNALGEFVNNESFMYADMRVVRLRERFATSSEPISKAPALLEMVMKIPADSTMNEYDLDRAFVDLFQTLHPKLQKAIEYLVWKQSLEDGESDPFTFGFDIIQSAPRSEAVRAAIRHICSYAEYHREYLPHQFVLYTDDPEMERIILEGIYNITLQVTPKPVE